MSRITGLSKPVRRLARRAYEGVHHRAEVAALRDAPWGSAAEMDRLRLRLLNETLQRASRQSPFYREVLGSFGPDLQAVDELARVPVTTRGDMRASRLEHAYPGGTLSRRKTWRTSGSSGEPFVFAIDLLYPTRHEAQRAFVYLEAGLTPGARIVELLPGTAKTSRSGFTYPTFKRTVIGYRSEGLGEAVRAARPSLLYGK
jgi:phenylacetate-coenzyme A ligase PaaK-like adenylate-forming protein